jgi:8-oxo-dGTP pyrophosphatase MutT (NUDIX family)
MVQYPLIEYNNEGCESVEKIRLRACALIIQDGAILLIEYRNDDEDGVHYNLPAGGLEPGETFVEAVQREAKEEACANLEVGPVAFVYEYQPAKNNYIYGSTHSVGITFQCVLKAGSIPQLPQNPDPNQTAVSWISISELHSIRLYPEINQDIMDYCNGSQYRNYVEEHEIQQGKLP